MSEPEVARRRVRTFYRAVDADGLLWCESRDPLEIVTQCAKPSAQEHRPFTYQRFDIYETWDGWADWNPATVTH